MVSTRPDLVCSPLPLRSILQCISSGVPATKTSTSLVESMSFSSHARGPAKPNSTPLNQWGHGGLQTFGVRRRCKETSMNFAVMVSQASYLGGGRSFEGTCLVLRQSLGALQASSQAGLIPKTVEKIQGIYSLGPYPSKPVCRCHLTARSSHN